MNNPSRLLSHDSHHEAETDLATRLRNQADMIAVVSHDLRHPLFRLALAAELASTHADHRAALARMLETINETVANMMRLVEDLDDCSSLEAGKLRLTCMPIHPATIVTSALVAFAPLAASRLIELSARIGDGLSEIVADRDRLLQVVSNLLANAISMTPTGGAVGISVDLDGDAARFAVSDSGPGIDPNDLPNLFERSWRGSHNRYEGRGLGLAIAQGLVESHGGRIWAENEATRGACISFTIQIQQSA